MSYKSHRKSSVRVFDNLYDPIFTQPSNREVWRKNFVSLYRSAVIRRYPVYKTMFTDLPRCPRLYRIRQQNPLPYIPLVCRARTSLNHFRAADNISLFLSAPMVKAITDDVYEVRCKDSKNHGKLFEMKGIGLQSYKRDALAQTEIWLPNAIVKRKSNLIPVMVYLARKGDEHTKLQAIQKVIRCKRRHYWENVRSQYVDNDSNREIGNISDINNKFEELECLAREHIIEYNQKIRMHIVEKLVTNRDYKLLQTNKLKLSELTSYLNINNSEKTLLIRARHYRTVRKFGKSKITEKNVGENIFNEHTDYSSNLYGSQLKEGIQNKNYNYLPLTTNLQTKPLNYCPKIEPKTAVTQNRNPNLSKPKDIVTEIKIGFRSDRILKDIHENLKYLRIAFEEKKKYKPKCLIFVKEESLETIDTLSNRFDLNDEDELNQKVTYLQKLIKGRATQNIIYQGRNKCRSLITELQSTNIITEMNYSRSPSYNSNQQQNIIFERQIYLEHLMRNECQIFEILQKIQGISIIFIFDLLNKEIQRMIMLKKIQCQGILNGITRSHLECKEAGQRQNDMKNRLKVTNMVQFLGKTNQLLTSTYMKKIFSIFITRFIRSKTKLEIPLTAINIVAEDLISELVTELDINEWTACAIIDYVFDGIDVTHNIIDNLIEGL